ncbi:MULTISPECIES: Rieske (2Fe-2S) protein [unclassified Luteimonas]|uniref:Rieske (2Fe-2S) protein n=1 Tax=unclassified Luteimonas TaxID=2629088 RepID=UPI0015FEBA7D|nr:MULTISPECIES: Rieske (2Fe-2S) protein [unclassified Luteimonas]MBB1472818.1 Rieske (2Fe-2S) protein [Luteimonas sp. MC1782]MBB6598478.1 Rieske (2Fe-2S) protein [Luteimonas sp. MC1825]QOC88671.1 Rieske (2Fe-2S) protein [Luteimonas sp. MC1825]
MSKDVSEALIGSGAAESTPLRTLASIAPGGFAECEGLVDGDMDSIILHRDAADGVRAWLNICPHAGRRLDWAPGQFLKARDGQLVCAVHGATFETVGGLCTAGPCRGEALRAVAVVVRDGLVYLAG